MKLRVWRKTSGKEIKYYYVKDLDEAALVITVLAIKEIDDDSIGYNAGGVEMYDDIDNEWYDFYDEDGYSFDDLKNEYMDLLWERLRGEN